MDNYILSLITFLPLVGILPLILMPRGRERAIKYLALGVAGLDFIVSLYLYFGFDSSAVSMQFVQRFPWIGDYGINYYLGLDGISLFLVLLTTFLTPIVILSSWEAITEKVKEYMICFLLLETAMIGAFVSLNLFLFYIFWEAMLIPMYFIIGVWGGPHKIYATIKFFLFTLFGSLLMLVAIMALYFMYAKQFGTYSFDLMELYRVDIPLGAQLWLFAAFGLSFAIKVPIFPFHTWLPDAHVEAPTAGSVILAGVLLKMGTYGFIRFAMPLFPEAAEKFMPLIAVLSIIGIIYGALVAMVQPDLKKLIAYSSVSHLGFVMLGLFALNVQGIEGAILQMVNHGLSTGALFLLVGIIYERRHTRMIEDFGGLSRTLPIFAAFFMIVTLSSIGLPGLNGFVGEILILIGVFKARYIYGILAATGVVLGAVYMLWMFQRVMFGEIKREENRVLKDMNGREIAVLLPIILMIFLIGLYPRPFLKKMDASVESFLSQVVERAPMPMEMVRAEEAKQVYVNQEEYILYETVK